MGAAWVPLLHCPVLQMLTSQPWRDMHCKHAVRSADPGGFCWITLHGQEA
jgi:hypothetical protein